MLDVAVVHQHARFGARFREAIAPQIDPTDPAMAMEPLTFAVVMGQTMGGFKTKLFIYSPGFHAWLDVGCYWTPTGRLSTYAIESKDDSWDGASVMPAWFADCRGRPIQVAGKQEPLRPPALDCKTSGPHLGRSPV
jgi:hypothetical protein